MTLVEINKKIAEIIAGMALQGIVREDMETLTKIFRAVPDETSFSIFTRRAYMLADAMLKEREKNNE